MTAQQVCRAATITAVYYALIFAALPSLYTATAIGFVTAFIVGPLLLLAHRDARRAQTLRRAQWLDVMRAYQRHPSTGNLRAAWMRAHNNEGNR